MVKVIRESINFKLPKPLAAALHKAARERNTTATDLVIQGLQHILGSVPGIETSVETRLTQLEELLANGSDTRIDDSTETRLAHLEIKLETVTARLAQFESALMTVQNHLNTRSSYSRKSSLYYTILHSRSASAVDAIGGKRLGTTAQYQRLNTPRKTRNC